VPVEAVDASRQQSSREKHSVSEINMGTKMISQDSSRQLSRREAAAVSNHQKSKGTTESEVADHEIEV